jgi:hypothetical protein
MYTKAQELINLLANSIYDRERAVSTATISRIPTEIFFTSKETNIVENFLQELEREIKKPAPEGELYEHNKDFSS